MPTRPVSGVIIFDNARRIQWKQGASGEGVAVPGYEGLGGLYAQLLGDERFTPYAVLSSEQYLPYDEADPLPPRIAAFVERELMQGEIAQAMFDLVTQGLDLASVTRESLRQRWDALIAGYIPALSNVHAARPGDFSQRVLRPLRQQIRTLDLGPAGERLLARLDLRNIHFADLVNTFFDYAIIARYFRQARVAELEQVSGARQKFFVIPMASGSRKLLDVRPDVPRRRRRIAAHQHGGRVQLGAHRLERDHAQRAHRRHRHAVTSRPGSSCAAGRSGRGAPGPTTAIA